MVPIPTWKGLRPCWNRHPPSQVENLLKQHSVSFDLLRHPPVLTSEEAAVSPRRGAVHRGQGADLQSG
jgi:hypothetical protein